MRRSDRGQAETHDHFGARGPEIIRLSAVIKKCDRYFEHVLVHTGQIMTMS